VAAAAIAGMLGISLTGCASGGSSSEQTVTVWSYFSTPQQLEYQKEAAKFFNGKYPDVKVDYVNIPAGQLDSKLLAAAGTHSGPDVVVNNPSADFAQLDAAGVMADMTKQWASLGDPSPYPDSVVWRDADKKIKTFQTYLNIQGLWYNKTLLNEYSIPVPKTIDEFESAMAVLKQNGKTALLNNADPGVDGTWSWYPFLAGEGVDFCSIDSPETVKVLQRLDGWAKKGYLPTGYQELTNVQTPSMFTKGDVGFLLNGNWNLGQIQKEAKFEFGTTEIPAGPKGTHVLPGGEGQAVGGYAKNPKMAWEYLKLGWLSKKAQQASLEIMGSLVTRTDMQSALKEKPYLGGFLSEIATVGKWPSGKNSLTAVTNFGNTISGFAAGQYSAQDAADKLASGLKTDLGSGGC
jgi:ABC-type glycerol-3-phosphate transport system substrate-binding protein